MPQVPIQKKLAAILVADVVAYTRLMEIDEVGTTQRLIRVRHEIFEPLVKENGGRIFKVTGDGALAEFKSSADAVRAAVSIQNALNEAGLEDPVASKVELRIGISLGDVITQGGDLVGTAVNVAARLESICDPGSVFVSSGVFDQIRSGNATHDAHPSNAPEVQCYHAAQVDAMAS